MRRFPAKALAVTAAFVALGSCSRDASPPAVTVVFFGHGAPASYECDELSLIGHLSDGRAQYRCSIWGKSGPGP